MKTKRNNNLVLQFEKAWLNDHIAETNKLSLQILKKWGLDVGEMYDLEFVNQQWVPITPPLKQETSIPMQIFEATVIEKP